MNYDGSAKFLNIINRTDIIKCDEMSLKNNCQPCCSLAFAAVGKCDI